jgi:hypothetical protein
MMRVKAFAPALVAAIALCAADAWATAYYVDATSGDDLNPGTSYRTPWKTLGKVNQTALAPGDWVMLKRGEVWHEQLIVPSSGVYGKKIRFLSYGAAGTSNPLISRSDLYTNWWEHSLIANGSFEDFTDRNPDSFDGWLKVVPTFRDLQAETTLPTVAQEVSARMTAAGAGTGWGQGSGVELYQSFKAKPGTFYYIQFSGRVSTTNAYNLCLRVADLGKQKYWIPGTNGGTWGTSTQTIASSMSGKAPLTWAQQTILVKTLPDSSGNIELRFGNWATGTCWLDDVYVAEGTGPWATKIWAGHIPGGLAKLRGVVINGVRGPEMSVSSNEEALNIPLNMYAYRSKGVGYFFYRNDRSAPPEGAEVGVRQFAILVRNRGYIDIDNIDMCGTGAGISSNDATRGLLMVDGVSSNVRARGLSVWHSTGAGVMSLLDATDIQFENIDTHDNRSSGFSIGSWRTVVRFCKSHDNGRIPGDIGDRGGIATNGGAMVSITDNEVYRNGIADEDVEQEIASVNLRGPIYISRNYVHDCDQGGIMISDGGAGSEISYNVIQRFGTTRYPPDRVLTGKFGGIALGGNQGIVSPGVRIYNNTIIGGRQALMAGHGSLTIATPGYPGAIVKNNLFVDNTCMDIAIGGAADLNGLTFDYNLYAKSAGNWAWGGREPVNSLASWQAASGQDANALVVNPVISPVLESGGFRLTSGSLAIDRGTYVRIPKDFFGVPVPQGLRVDIGACEYTPPPANNPTEPVPSGLWNGVSRRRPGLTGVSRFRLYP